MISVKLIITAHAKQQMLLRGIDEIVVSPGAEQLKLDMTALLEDIAQKVEAGEEVEVED